MARRPPQTRYAQSSGAKIAYQVSGTGPPDLVMVHGLVSHLDLQWQQAGYRRFVRALEQGARVIRLDKRGTGLSDPVADLPTTEQRVQDVAAVMAAARSSRAVLFGLSDGGRAAIAFAAAHPGRTRGLILYGTSYRGPRAALLRRYRAAVRHWGEGRLRVEPAVTVDILEDISRADGSAGWTLVTGNSTAFFAWLDPVVAKDLIGPQPDFVSTSMWAPLGQATAQPGGFSVSGRWPFNSGCPHATWLQVGVLVTEDGRPRTLACGAPDWRFAFVPARSAVIEDTWDAMGLCGTGSHHLSLSGVAVPAERLAAPFFEPARHDGPLWRIPLITLAAMFLAAVPLGIARRALEEFTALAARKVRGPAAQSIGHDAAAQVELARAEGALAAGRSFLFDAIGGVWDTACRGDEPSLAQRALVLLAANQATRAGTEAVDRVFRLAGADAVFARHPLQRCLRDIHAAGQHILFSGGRDQAFAKVRLGIDQPTYLI